jgi:hypothetical protein
MAFLAKVSIDGGAEINVLQCSFKLTQSTDATGKPSAVPQGGYLSIVVESTKATDLYEWMISPTSTKKGIVTFYRRDMMSKLKTVEFIDGYCVDYHESFDHRGEHPMQIAIVVSAKILKVNESEFKNNWPS